MRKLPIKIFLVLLLIAALLEVGLRISGLTSTHPEKNFGVFINPFVMTTESPYWLWAPYDTVVITNRDFEYVYKTNSMGIVDKELDSLNVGSVIAFLGDSFTQGCGADSDSCMPRAFERLVWETDTTTFVLNAGIPASDLIFSTRLLEDKLYPEGIRRFVLCINTSDLYDYIWRGGMERFNEDGTTSTNTAPWYFTIYQYSHLFRAFFHGILRYDHSYVTRKKEHSLKSKAAEDFAAEVVRINKVIKEDGGELIVVLQPYPAQFSSDDNGHLDDYVYLEDMRSKIEETSIRCIDTEPEFYRLLNPENYLDYSWLIDQHFNGAGYEMYAYIVYNEIKKRYPEFLEH